MQKILPLLTFCVVALLSGFISRPVADGYQAVSYTHLTLPTKA